MRPSLVIFSLQATLTSLGCVSTSQDDTGVVSSAPSSAATSDSSGGSTDASACGDGAPSAAKFCFTSVGVPKLGAPRAAVGGTVHNGPQVSFVALNELTSELATLDYIGGQMVPGAPVAIGGANPGNQLRLADFGGSPLPDLVVASVGSNSKLLSNDDGVFGGVEGFVLPGESGNGLLVPIDINGDGLSEIIKGIDGFARLYVREGENWSLQEPSLS